MNIDFVYFSQQIHIATRNGIKPFHSLSSDRHKLDVKGSNLVVVIDDLTTIVPLANVASIVLHKNDQD